MKEFYLLREVFLLAILFAAAVSDIRLRTISNVLTAVSLPLGLAFSILAPQKTNIYTMTGLVLIVLLLLVFWHKKKIGGGDVKLVFLMAFLFPTESGLSLIALSFLLDLVIGILHLSFTKKAEVPLAPGMFLAAVLELFIHGGKL